MFRAMVAAGHTTTEEESLSVAADMADTASAAAYGMGAAGREGLVRWIDRSGPGGGSYVSPAFWLESACWALGPDLWPEYRPVLVEIAERILSEYENPR